MLEGDQGGVVGGEVEVLWMMSHEVGSGESSMTRSLRLKRRVGRVLGRGV